MSNILKNRSNRKTRKVIQATGRLTHWRIGQSMVLQCSGSIFLVDQSNKGYRSINWFFIGNKLAIGRSTKRVLT